MKVHSGVKVAEFRDLLGLISQPLRERENKNEGLLIPEYACLGLWTGSLKVA